MNSMWALVDDDGRVLCVADEPDENLTGDNEWTNLTPEMAEALGHPYEQAVIDEHGRLKVTVPPPPPRARVTKDMLQQWAVHNQRAVDSNKLLQEHFTTILESEQEVVEAMAFRASESSGATLPIWRIVGQQRLQLASLTLALNATLQALDATRAQLALVGQAVCLQDEQDADAQDTVPQAAPRVD